MGPPSEQSEGVCRASSWSPDLFYATDATGGPHASDPRGRVIAWAVCAFSWEEGSPLQVGQLTGLLPPGSTVAEGESFAVARLCATLSAPADCTTDSQAVLSQQGERSLGPGRGPRLRGKEAWAKPTWTRSHTDAQAHEAEFGPRPVLETFGQ